MSDDDDDDGGDGHVHQVASWQRVGNDRVGYCSCLEECARVVNYYDD